MPYVSLEWLSEHVEVLPGTDLAELAKQLVKVGLEEERIVPAKVTGPLVVGRVLTMNPEPQSNGKTVNYCRVDVGVHNDEPGTGKEPSDLPSRGIICGAHNFKPGDLVVVSLPGAILPGPFPISARKTYGHISDGMICSERELELGNDHDGIMVLQEKFPDLAAAGQLPAPGESVLELLELGSESLEINITPDRGYCFSMRGVAREYSHATGAKFTDPGIRKLSNPANTADGFRVEVTDQNPIRGQIGCDRFVTRVVKNVDPTAPTPKWMVKRLETAGMRSISLAVDITNYVMLDLGQPLHAYDLAEVAEPIVVRRAEPGESLVTLDDVTRDLDGEDLLITDSPNGQTGSRVLGLAGVMGGASSEVKETTTSILVEAARFDPVSVARTSRRHRLPSEAAKRFERGIDPLLASVAAQRVVDLLMEYGGAEDTGRCFDWAELPAPRVIEMDVNYPAARIGVEYTTDQVVESLRAVGCQVEESGLQLLVTPPSWRPDLTQPADLSEEVARLVGYDQIPSRLPQAPAGTGLTKSQQARRAAARYLAEAGLTEVLSYPWIAEDVFDKELLSEADVRRFATRLANPLGDDQPLLRTSILDSLLSTAARNVSRGNQDFALFEQGLVTRAQGTVLCGPVSAAERPSDEQLKALYQGVPTQPRHLAGVFVGQAERAGIYGPGRAYDWADAVETVRGLATVLGVKLDIRGTDTKQPESPLSVSGPLGDRLSVSPFHPGRCARIVVRGRTVGLAGQLHPRVAKNFGLPVQSCAFEVDFDAFVAALPKQAFQVTPVAVFPPAREDIALVVENRVTAADLMALISKQAGELLEDLHLFDVYTGDQVPEGHKSLAFSLQLRSASGTLSAQEITEVRNRVIRAAAKKFKAELRS